MQKLRSLHLYLGCIFAPMLLFFAVSGIWQTLGFFGSDSALMARLSTIHTSHQLKNGTSLSGGVMVAFVVVMALAFIVTTILGVVMALRYGRSRRAALVCLAFGFLFPLLLVALRAFGIRT